MRNIKVQVKSFDLVPRLSPELHRKSERRRKLLVGFNGVFRRLATDSRWSEAKVKLAIPSWFAAPSNGGRPMPERSSSDAQTRTAAICTVARRDRRSSSTRKKKRGEKEAGRSWRSWPVRWQERNGFRGEEQKQEAQRHDENRARKVSFWCFLLLLFFFVPKKENFTHLKWSLKITKVKFNNRDNK